MLAEEAPLLLLNAPAVTLALGRGPEADAGGKAEEEGTGTALPLTATGERAAGGAEEGGGAETALLEAAGLLGLSAAAIEEEAERAEQGVGAAAAAAAAAAETTTEEEAEEVKGEIGRIGTEDGVEEVEAAEIATEAVKGVLDSISPLIGTEECGERTLSLAAAGGAEKEGSAALVDDNEETKTGMDGGRGRRRAEGGVGGLGREEEMGEKGEAGAAAGGRGREEEEEGVEFMVPESNGRILLISLMRTFFLRLEFGDLCLSFIQCICQASKEEHHGNDRDDMKQKGVKKK